MSSRADVPRAFDEAGLALAQWLAETYLCSLRDALAAIVLADAVPRIVERLVPVGQRPPDDRFPSVPARLVALLWGDLREGVAPAALLRHAEARRAGDRRTLTNAIAALVRGGVLERRRTTVRPAVAERTVRVLEPGDATIRGRSAAALGAYVREHGEVRRSDAVLAGFSDAVVRRAIAAGAVRETQRSLGARTRPAGLACSSRPASSGRHRCDRDRARTGTRNCWYTAHRQWQTLVYLHAIAHVLAAAAKRSCWFRRSPDA